MVTAPFPALPQPKALLERFHQVIGGGDQPSSCPASPALLVLWGGPPTLQLLSCLCVPSPGAWPPPLLVCAPYPSTTCPPPQVPSGIILQNKAGGAPAAPQTSASLGPLASPTASVLVSGQAPSGTPTAPSHPPAPAPMATAGRGEVAHAGEVGGPEDGRAGGGGRAGAELWVCEPEGFPQTSQDREGGRERAVASDPRGALNSGLAALLRPEDWKRVGCRLGGRIVEGPSCQ